MHPTVCPAGLMVNSVEGCVPMTQARPDLIDELNPLDWKFEIRSHGISKRRGQVPLNKFLLHLA